MTFCEADLVGDSHSRKILVEYDTGYSKEYPCEEVIPPILGVFK